jgi:hypothetical protein
MRKLVALMLLAGCHQSLYPQDVVQTAAPAQRKLVFVIPGLLDDLLAGLPQPVQAVARTAALPRISIASVNSGLAAELSNLPASSSASALRYVFDRSVGAYVPTAQSLGPVLSERAETIGKDKVFFAVTYQRFQFDHQDDLDLRNIRSTVPLSIPAGLLGPFPVQVLVDATASYSIIVNQTTAHLTYGLTHWLDASYAFPILSNSVSFQATATVAASGTASLFPAVARSVQASSTGLGDGVARIKAKFFDASGLALAFATDVRLPIGDEFNLHGAGAYGVKPFLIASYTTRAVSPHINAGFQWNGRSYLASTSGRDKQKLPSQAFFSAGADIAVSKRLTAAFDVIDQIVINGPRLIVESEEPANAFSIQYTNRTRHEVNGAGGFKLQMGGDFVLTGNLLFRLNTAGLRARVVPLAGLSYVF